MRVRSLPPSLPPALGWHRHSKGILLCYADVRSMAMTSLHSFKGPHSIKVQKKGLFDVTVESAAEPQVWNKDTNCLVDKTTSYGLMLFREPDDDNNGEIIQSHVHNGKPYVRVAATDCLNHPEWIRDMLVNKWDLDPPRILLAVTGGAMAFDLPPKLDEMIRIGLQKAGERGKPSYRDSARGH